MGRLSSAYLSLPMSNCRSDQEGENNNNRITTIDHRSNRGGGWRYAGRK